MKNNNNSTTSLPSTAALEYAMFAYAAAEAEKKYGELLEEGKHPNPMALAFFLSQSLGKIVYIEPEDRLYRRDQTSGLFVQLPEDLLANEILDFLITFFRKDRGIAVCHKLTSRLAKELIRLLKRFCSNDHFLTVNPARWFFT